MYCFRKSLGQTHNNMTLENTEYELKRKSLIPNIDVIIYSFLNIT